MFLLQFCCFFISGLFFDEYFLYYLFFKLNLLFFSYYYGWSVYIFGSDMVCDRSIYDMLIVFFFNFMICYIYVENNFIKFNVLYIIWVVIKVIIRFINNFLCFMFYLFFIWSNQIFYFELFDVIKYLLIEFFFFKEIYIV